MKTIKNKDFIQMHNESLFSICKNVIIILLLIIGTEGQLQAQSKLASEEEVGMFLNSTTCVVLEEGGVSYNILVKDAVEKYWEITDYEFIDMDEFEDRRVNSAYSFLMVTKVTFEDDPAGVEYNFLNLLQGKNTAVMEDMPELANLPLSYIHDEEVDYTYAMPAILKFVQRHVRTLKSKRGMINTLGLGYYNQGRKFKDKALLLREDHMAPEVNTEIKIKDVYPFHFMLLTPEEMIDELQEPRSEVILLHHVGPAENNAAGQCFELIFSPNGELYYYNKRQVTNDNPDGFTKWDLRRIRL